MKKFYELKFRNAEGEPINFTDWEKKTVDFLEEHKNIKKVWLVNNQRKTGATYFAKLLMFFRKPCTKTFVVSDKFNWSLCISNQLPIEFLVDTCEAKDFEYYKASNFLTPVPLYGLIKEIEICDEAEKVFECLYDNEFDETIYNILCSCNFNFFIINVSTKDLEKAKPFIEADKYKEDVLIVNIETPLIQ